MSREWLPQSALRELLSVTADLIDALRQPVVLATLALLLLLLAVRFAMGAT